MNTLDYGTRRQGKSTLALAQAISGHSRVVIFDPNGQFPLVERVAIEHVRDRLEDFNEGLGHPVPYNQSFLVLRVGPFDTQYVPKAFEDFSEVLFGEPELSVIIDEAHMLQGANWIDPNLDRWNRRSPSSVDVIQTTHRIVDAHPDSRYHADHVFFFFTDNELELKTIAKSFGKELPPVISRLELHQVVHWWRERGGFRRWSVWRNPEAWYIDLENENKVVEYAR